MAHYCPSHPCPICAAPLIDAALAATNRPRLYRDPAQDHPTLRRLLAWCVLKRKHAGMRQHPAWDAMIDEVERVLMQGPCSGCGGSGDIGVGGPLQGPGVDVVVMCGECNGTGMRT